MKTYGIAHIAIMAEDYEETVSFYTNLLNFKKVHYWSLPQYKIKEACMLKSLNGETYIEVFDKNADVPREGNILKNVNSEIHGHILHFALTVDSITEVITFLKNKNVKILTSHENLTLGNPGVKVTNAIIEGPNGEVIELLEKVTF